MVGSSGKASMTAAPLGPLTTGESHSPACGCRPDFGSNPLGDPILRGESYHGIENPSGGADKSQSGLTLHSKHSPVADLPTAWLGSEVCARCLHQIQCFASGTDPCLILISGPVLLLA